MDQISRVQERIESMIKKYCNLSAHLNDATIIAKRSPTLTLQEISTHLLSTTALWHALKTGHLSFLQAAALATVIKTWLASKAKEDGDLCVDSKGTVMVSRGLSLQRLGVQTLMLYASAVAATQFRSASLLTKSCYAGLVSLMMSWVYHKNATRFVWLTWHDTAKKVARRVGGVPVYWLLKDSSVGVAFTLLSSYLLSKKRPGTLRNGLKTYVKWLDDYQQTVFYTIASGIDQVAAEIFPLPAVVKSAMVGALCWPTALALRYPLQLLSFENPNYPTEKSLRALTSALLFTAAEGLDVAKRRSSEEREYFSNYTTVAKERKVTNLFVVAVVGYMAVQMGIAVTQKPEEHTTVTARADEKPRFNSAGDYMLPAVQKTEAEARVKEITAELESVNRFMEKNHADIMRMIETTNEALSWEERAVKKLSYLQDQGIVDEVVAEVAAANREKVSRLRGAVEEKIYRARKVQQDLARKRRLLQDKIGSLESSAAMLACEKDEVRGIQSPAPREEIGTLCAVGALACVALAGSMHRGL